MNSEVGFCQISTSLCPVDCLWVPVSRLQLHYLLSPLFLTKSPYNCNSLWYFAFFFLKPRKWHNQSELCLKLIWQHCTEREKWGADVQLESCYCSLGVRKLFLWHRLRAKKYEEERLGMNNAADAEESAGLGFGWSWTTGQRKKEFLVELHSLIQSLAPYGSALFAV